MTYLARLSWNHEAAARVATLAVLASLSSGAVACASRSAPVVYPANAPSSTQAPEVSPANVLVALSSQEPQFGAPMPAAGNVTSTPANTEAQPMVTPPTGTPPSEPQVDHSHMNHGGHHHGAH